MSIPCGAWSHLPPSHRWRDRAQCAIIGRTRRCATIPGLVEGVGADLCVYPDATQNPDAHPKSTEVLTGLFRCLTFNIDGRGRATSRRGRNQEGGLRWIRHRA